MIQRGLDGVRLERTGLRDMAISQRHRNWGFNCPAVDLDFLMVEYNSGLPVAIVEYKHQKAQLPDYRHPTIRALRSLADHYAKFASADATTRGAAATIDPLAFLVAFYWPDCWAFRVHPMNDTARESFGDEEMLTERQFVTRLYELRQLRIGTDIISRLNNRLPAEARMF